MALEDLALFRSVHGSTVFYPSDAVSTERAVELAAQTQGICFIRTGRPANPVLYANDAQFAVGKAHVCISAACSISAIFCAVWVSYVVMNVRKFVMVILKVVRENPEDKVLVVGAGVTLHEAVKAADALKAEGVHVCILDPFTIKPIDAEALAKQAVRCGGRVVTVEDHYPAGKYYLRLRICNFIMY